jgi:hypothetical protein
LDLREYINSDFPVKQWLLIFQLRDQENCSLTSQKPADTKREEFNISSGAGWWKNHIMGYFFV